VLAIATVRRVSRQTEPGRVYSSPLAQSRGQVKAALRALKELLIIVALVWPQLDIGTVAMYYIVLASIVLAGDLALALLVAAFIRRGRGGKTAQACGDSRIAVAETVQAGPAFRGHARRSGSRPTPRAFSASR
jgi:hypothetical protein